MSYQGPVGLEALCKKFQWTLFDRVEEIRFSRAVGLDPKSLSQFRNLREVSSGGKLKDRKEVLIAVVGADRISHFEQHEYSSVAVLH